MKYRELVAGREAIYDATAMSREVIPGAIRDRVSSLHEALAYLHAIPGPAVLWVHESAAERWRLPDTGRELARDLGFGDDVMSSPGWFRLSRDKHVALPTYSDDFAGLEGPIDLGCALRLFDELVGMQFMFSAPSTILTLIAAKWARPLPLAQPSGVRYAASAFTIPAHVWTREPDARDRALPAVQLFDRRGSYLAAWRSAELPVAAPGAASAWITLERPSRISGPGYYFIDTRELATFLERQRIYDPFARVHGEHLEGAIWLTEPLATLAHELAIEAGIGLECERAVISGSRTRALDVVAERLGQARVFLEGSPLEYAPAVLRALKDGYTRGTAHLEFGRKPGHAMHRPEWRHTITERSVANTFRSLRKAARRPIVVGGIDAAVFAVDWRDTGHDVPSTFVIDGLRMDSGLGSWKRRGEPMPRSNALRRLHRKARDPLTNARELIATLANTSNGGS